MHRDTRPIGWIKAARKDFKKFPKAVRDRINTALTIAAEGRKADIAKPMKGLGSGRFLAIVCFTLDGADADRIAADLRADHINVSVSAPSSTLLDAKARNLPDLIRASPHYYNTEDEIDRFAQAIAAL